MRCGLCLEVEKTPDLSAAHNPAVVSEVDGEYGDEVFLRLKALVRLRYVFFLAPAEEDLFANGHRQIEKPIDTYSRW